MVYEARLTCLLQARPHSTTHGITTFNYAILHANMQRVSTADTLVMTVCYHHASHGNGRWL